MAGRPGLLLAFAGLALAACGGGEAVLAPPCPNISVLADTAEVTKFRSGLGRDLTDVVLEARITDYSGFCDTDLDDGAGGEVQVELRLLIEVARGPANGSRRGSYDFFVAIGDRERNILAKQVFTSEVEFEGNRNRLTAVEDLEQTIPLGAGELGDDYDIYVGFQLSEDELLYNRRKVMR